MKLFDFDDLFFFFKSIRHSCEKMHNVKLIISQQLQFCACARDRQNCDNANSNTALTTNNSSLVWQCDISLNNINMLLAAFQGILIIGIDCFNPIFLLLSFLLNSIEQVGVFSDCSYQIDVYRASVLFLILVFHPNSWASFSRLHQRIHFS